MKKGTFFLAWLAAALATAMFIFFPVILYRAIVLISDKSDLLPDLFEDLPYGWIAVLSTFGATLVVAILQEVSR